MQYPRLYVDDSGESHFGETEAKFAPMEYAPPAPPFGVSEATDASRYIFVKFPAGWESEPHPTPRRQLFVVLSGEIEGTASDGESRTFGPGNTLLMEDTEGKGHAARVVSDGEVHALMIHLE